MPKPRIIPVLDLLGGEVVRAVGGRRNEYRPIVSRLADSTEPLPVARALLAATGAQELYVADLDAIRGGARSKATRDFLDAIDVPVWFDGGPAWGPWPDVVRPVVGFESTASPAALSEATAFSLDLWNGELFGPWQSWGVASPNDLFGVLDRVFAKGVRTLIVLDLTAVGTSEGPATLTLCGRIRERYPTIELLTGGGVRNANDLARLGEVGVDGALIASAIHDGHFTIEISA